MYIYIYIYIYIYMCVCVTAYHPPAVSMGDEDCLRVRVLGRTVNGGLVRSIVWEGEGMNEWAEQESSVPG